MTDAAGTAISSPPPAPLPARSASPPRWWFHGALAIATLVMLWSQSTPGFDIRWAFAGLVMWFVLGVIWLVRLILCLVGGGRPRWWLLVAPAMAVAMIVMIVADLPLKARFELSRADFDTAVAALPTDVRSNTGPGRIGSYEITSWRRTADGLILNEGNGDFMDDAGFAYLPEGPTPDLANSGFENPQFVALGDGWYAWTASW